MPGFRAETVGEEVSGTDPAGVQGGINIPADGSIVWDAFALTWDYTVDVSDQPDLSVSVPSGSLLDLTAGNEWRLRRIVGKAFLGAASDELDDPPANQSLIDAAVAFIVCKTYDDGAPLTDFNEVNPLTVEAYDDPWIWRRRWVLNPFALIPYHSTNDGTTSNIGRYAYLNFPNTTAGYGSAVDGPHIDQKTARRIHRQERLFCVIAARSLKWNLLDTAEQRLQYLIDYRLLGTVSGRSSGNRRNASR